MFFIYCRILMDFVAELLPDHTELTNFVSESDFLSDKFRLYADVSTLMQDWERTSDLNGVPSHFVFHIRQKNKQNLGFLLHSLEQSGHFCILSDHKENSIQFGVVVTSETSAWQNLSIEFFTIGVSVRLSVRFNVTQNKLNFVKKCPQWGWKPGPSDLQASALPTELSQHSVASLKFYCLYKVMLYWF